MEPENVKNINFEGYSVDQISRLNNMKARIQRILIKYIPKSEDGVCDVWEDLETIQQDHMQVASILAYISPIIGYICGYAEHLDEIKKLSMAKARVEQLDNAEDAVKKTTEKQREDFSRVASEQIIIANINLKSMAYEYNKFNYQVNSWLNVLDRRIRTLLGERSFESKVNRG